MPPPKQNECTVGAAKSKAAMPAARIRLLQRRVPSKIQYAPVNVLADKPTASARKLEFSLYESDEENQQIRTQEGDISISSSEASSFASAADNSNFREVYDAKEHLAEVSFSPIRDDSPDASYDHQFDSVVDDSLTSAPVPSESSPLIPSVQDENQLPVDIPESAMSNARRQSNSSLEVKARKIMERELLFEKLIAHSRSHLEALEQQMSELGQGYVSMRRSTGSIPARRRVEVPDRHLSPIRDSDKSRLNVIDKSTDEVDENFKNMLKATSSPNKSVGSLGKKLAPRPPLAPSTSNHAANKVIDSSLLSSSQKLKSLAERRPLLAASPVLSNVGIRN